MAGAGVAGTTPPPTEGVPVKILSSSTSRLKLLAPPYVFLAPPTPRGPRAEASTAPAEAFMEAMVLLRLRGRLMGFVGVGGRDGEPIWGKEEEGPSGREGEAWREEWETGERYGWEWGRSGDELVELARENEPVERGGVSVCRLRQPHRSSPGLFALSVDRPAMAATAFFVRLTAGCVGTAGCRPLPPSPALNSSKTLLRSFAGLLSGEGDAGRLPGRDAEGSGVRGRC